MNLRTLVTGAVVGILVYGGAYFFMPPPYSAYASVAGMDYFDLRTDYDFVKAVEDIVED